MYNCQALEQQLEENAARTQGSEQQELQALKTTLLEKENVITGLQNQLLRDKSAADRLIHEFGEREADLKYRYLLCAHDCGDGFINRVCVVDTREKLSL